MDTKNRLTKNEEWQVGTLYRYCKGRLRKNSAGRVRPMEGTFLGWAENGRLVGYAEMQLQPGGKITLPPNTWRNRWIRADADPRPALPPIEAVKLGDLQAETKPSRVIIDATNNAATLHFAYPYEIDLGGIPDEAALLRWALHLCEKSWIDTEALHEVITVIGAHKGFKLHGH